MAKSGLDKYLDLIYSFEENEHVIFFRWGHLLCFLLLVLCILDAFHLHRPCSYMILLLVMEK